MSNNTPTKNAGAGGGATSPQAQQQQQSPAGGGGGGGAAVNPQEIGQLLHHTAFNQDNQQRKAAENRLAEVSAFPRL